MALGEFDPLRRIGVAGQKVEAGIGAGFNGGETLVGVHGVKKPRCRIGIVTGLAQHSHSDDIGLKFLIAGEGGQ